MGSRGNRCFLHILVMSKDEENAQETGDLLCHWEAALVGQIKKKV